MTFVVLVFVVVLVVDDIAVGMLAAVGVDDDCSSVDGEGFVAGMTSQGHEIAGKTALLLGAFYFVLYSSSGTNSF